MKQLTKTLITLCFVLGITSCDLQKVENLQDTFQIKISSEIITSKTSIRIVNANGNAQVPSNISLQLSGENSDKIFTESGKKALDIDNGFITLGLRGVNASRENPFTVIATIKADGFIDKEQSISFDGSELQTITISLLEKNDLPEGIELKSINSNLVNDSTTSNIQVDFTEDNGNDNSLEFTIPQSTVFQDENQNTISGNNLTGDFQTFDTEAPDENTPPANDENPETISEASNEFPGGLGTDATSPKGIYKLEKRGLVQGYIVPVTNLYCFYLFVNGRRVYWFSKPTLVRNYIYRNAVNPNTGQSVQVGEEVDVYFYNRRTRSKELLTKVKIKATNSGRKYVEFNAPKPGVYPIGFTKSFNHSCTTINSIKFMNNGKKSFYYYYVANKHNPKRALRYGYMYFNGENEITNSNIDYWRNRAFNYLGDDMMLKIYTYSYDQRRYVEVYNQEISVCELNGQTIDISNPDCSETVDIDATLECKDATYILNYTPIYYKKSGQRWWRYYDRITNGKLQGQVSCLEDGVQYQFGFWYGKWRVTPPITKAQMTKLLENFDKSAICDLLD